MVRARAVMRPLSAMLGFLALAGCAGAQSVLAPAGKQAGDLAALLTLMAWVCGVMYALVIAFLAWSMWRARHRVAPEAPQVDPADAGLGRGLAIWAGAIVLGLTILVIGSFFAERSLASERGHDAIEIRVTGHQWWWRIEYRDPATGGWIETANELHLPVDRTARVALGAADVIHSFWVPNVAGKMDVLPGRINIIDLTPRQLGWFRGQCAEFCGAQHSHMAFDVKVESAADFANWLAGQRRPAAAPADPAVARGLRIVSGGACASCHAVRGTPAMGRAGPDLTHIGSRRSIAAGTLPMSRGALQGWILQPQGLKPGTMMPPTALNPADADAVVAVPGVTPVSADENQLRTTWRDAPGLWGFLTTVDHKRIAARYIVTTIALLFLAGMLALDMRLQLSAPDMQRMDPQQYDEAFSLHGSTMLFLVSVPVMEAMALWLVPLMLGQRNMAFPRLAAFSYWVYLGGVLMLWVPHALGITPDLGWFEYPPLSGPAYSPGHRADIWAQMITFTEVAALAASVNVVITILKMRPPGMTLARMPMFLWAMLVTSLMTIFALPSVMLVTSMLIADRLVSTMFFAPAAGGDVLLFQHLFWFFGHPEVYIIFIPAIGFVSAIVETFSRRTLFAHTAMVLSVLSIAVLAFGLWVHHMFAVGLPRLGNDFYTAASMAIALPAGMQIFCWIATMWGGRPRFDTPLLWVAGFIATFVIGGLSGVMTASAPLDLQLTDTYFVVAHLHYVLVGGALFPLFGAFCYWYPKAAGRLMSERWGKVSFWLIVGGFNLGFFPMHVLGLEGMPRRIYTYGPEMGWGMLNMVATAGACIAVAGGLVFVANALLSIRFGRVAGPDPWGGSTLEWATPSPPEPHNFAYTPVVDGIAPVWSEHATRSVMDGLADDRRQVLITSVVDAVPQYRQESADPSIWPLLAALAVTILFVWSIFSPWALVWGSIPVGAALAAWFWPKRPRATAGPLAVSR